jgi:1-acyl-sn-glycerol-3-phosphate acyltransferase
MEILKNGDHIFIFPEGTRNKTSDRPLIDFRDGAFSIAIQTQTPILPMLFTGTDKIMPNTTMRLRPGIIHIYHLDPIDVSGYTEDDVQRLKTETREVMMRAYEKISG